MKTIIIQSSDRDTLAKIKAFLEELKVSHEVEMVEEDNEKPYDTEFVQKILENADSAKEGNVIEYTEPLRKELFYSSFSRNRSSGFAKTFYPRFIIRTL